MKEEASRRLRPGPASISPEPAVPPIQFPHHQEPLETDLGNQYFFGDLIVRDGCLRLDYSDVNFPDLTLLLAWPSGFTMDVQDDSINILKDGQTVARVGDAVRFSGRWIEPPSWPLRGDEPGAHWRDRQLLQDWRQQERLWQQRLSVDCPGPFLLVGDEVSVVGPNEPTAIPVPGSTLLFVREKSQRGQRESELVGDTAELVLDGGCLRLGRARAMVVWPAGFSPALEDGQLLIRNGAGRTIARVGDTLEVIGAPNRAGRNPHVSRCPGAVWYVERLRNLSRR